MTFQFRCFPFPLHEKPADFLLFSESLSIRGAKVHLFLLIFIGDIFVEPGVFEPAFPPYLCRQACLFSFCLWLMRCLGKVTT